MFTTLPRLSSGSGSARVSRIFEIRLLSPDGPRRRPSDQQDEKNPRL
jgi:hypothetical protein